MNGSKATKVIKVALPILALAASVGLYSHNFLQTCHSFVVIEISIACGIIITVLSVIEWLMDARLSKAKRREKLSLEAEAQPVVAPELDKVKGNWYKKELVRRRLVREYVESHCSDKYSRKQSDVGNLSDWYVTTMICGIILLAPAMLTYAIELFWLALLYVPFVLICPASFKRHRQPHKVEC